MQRISKLWQQLPLRLHNVIVAHLWTPLGAPAARNVERYGLASLVAGALLLARGEGQVIAMLACAGGEPSVPVTPADAWVALENGEQQWYGFRDEGDNTPITVRMTVVPPNGAGFAVLTPSQAQQWTRGEPVTAVGTGTPSAALHDDLYWTGSFVDSGTYYVLVKSSDQGLSNYKLAINGKRVSFPLLSFSRPTFLPPPSNAICPLANDASASPLPTPTPVAADVTDTVTSTPENPLPPIGKRLLIAPNERHWYAFRDEGDESTIQIRADATPDNCLNFQVWTTDQLRLWRLNEEFRPVGQGTANTLLKADLFWSGSFVKSGIYYVVVERNRAFQGTCSYVLTVTGDDVSLVNPTLTP